jgi:hypothetical protein
MSDPTDTGIDRAAEVVELIELARASLAALPRDGEEEQEALLSAMGHLNDAWSALKRYATLRALRGLRS